MSDLVAACIKDYCTVTGIVFESVDLGSREVRSTVPEIFTSEAPRSTAAFEVTTEAQHTRSRDKSCAGNCKALISAAHR
jgi:hypothetical protein